MSRAATGDTVVLKPGNNMYTVLALIGCIATGIGIAVCLMRAKVLAPEWTLF